MTHVFILSASSPPSSTSLRKAEEDAVDAKPVFFFFFLLTVDKDKEFGTFLVLLLLLEVPLIGVG
jgi:hypothetical protein